VLTVTRLGHNATKHHLANIGVFNDNTCRHCQQASETVEHQVLECESLSTRLADERICFLRIPNAPSFNAALWSHPAIMTDILSRAKKKGCFI
jgi:hypothetical protein